jgi:pimeloyl-ACP methyl ester carboxylesterase
MCNPNALIYQWMVTSANAYWLDFFLRRDCNVLIWNYRGYGKSGQSMFSPNYIPNQQKIDVERVMQFLINRLRVQGPVGVYGRSIGGIAAAHLSQKFPDQIKVFVGDRTMGSFDKIVARKYGNSLFYSLYKILSCWWNIDNGEGIVKNPDCFKILCFDDEDDVFDTYCSLHHKVAAKMSSQEYNQQNWR